MIQKLLCILPPIPIQPLEPGCWVPHDDDSGCNVHQVELEVQSSVGESRFGSRDQSADEVAHGERSVVRRETGDVIYDIADWK